MKSIGSAARMTLALTLALAGAPHAYAQAQAQAAAHRYDVQVTMKLNGQDVTNTMQAQEDQPFTLSGNAGDRPWRAQFVLNHVHDANANGAKPAVRLAGTIVEDGKTLAKPTLTGWLGERMRIKVGDEVDLAFLVKELAP